MKIINDPIYRYIRLSDIAVQIIDTPLYERLNSIRQTSMAYRVFPSATHTRKSHQIGVYGLVQKTLDALIQQRRLIVSDQNQPMSCSAMTRHCHQGGVPTITSSEYEWICIGGLVHDLGHGPSSHSFDELIEEFVSEGLVEPTNPWITHESRGKDMFRRLIVEHRIPIDEEGVEYICNVIEPNRDHKHDFRFQFVNNRVCGLDLDKMEYILRDTREFGLSCTIDIDRIITNAGIHLHLRDSPTWATHLSSLVTRTESAIGTAIESVSPLVESVARRVGGPVGDPVGRQVGQTEVFRMITGGQLSELIEMVHRRSIEQMGTYWSFNEKVVGDIFHLFMTRFRLYKEIYSHPKVIKFEMSYRDLLVSQKEEIVRTICDMDVSRFVEMTDESMFWRAPRELRDRFIRRDTYRLVDPEPNCGLGIGWVSAKGSAKTDSAKTDGENLSEELPKIRVERTVGFLGKNGFNPFLHIRFFDKRTDKLVKIRLADISGLLTANFTSEKLVFCYEKSV